MRPINFNLGSECEKCGSPFHDTKECTQEAKPKFRFKSRQELGLQPGELPFKFRVEIDPDKDNEVEVARKKALLRLNSSRIYSQMGNAVKAHEASLDVSKFLDQMLENCEDEEYNLLKPLLSGLEILQSELLKLRKAKISQAEKMEEVLSTAQKQARKVRKAVKEKEAKKTKKNSEFFIISLPSEGSEPSVNLPVLPDSENPFEIFDEIKQAVLQKERLKKREYVSEEE